MSKRHSGYAGYNPTACRPARCGADAHPPCAAAAADASVANRHMNVLVLNCSSAAVRFAVVHSSNGHEHARASPSTSRRRRPGSTSITRSRRASRPLGGAGPEGALAAVRELLRELGLLDRMMGIGHRVVHGGARFPESTFITPRSSSGSRSASRSAPSTTRPTSSASTSPRSSSPASPRSPSSTPPSTRRCRRGPTSTRSRTSGSSSTRSAATASTARATGTCRSRR